MKEGRKPEYPENTPDDELQKMPHTEAWRIKPQARLKPAQQHWWQARKADTLTVTPRAAPELLMSYTTPHHTGWGERHTQLTELCLNKTWTEWESAFHPVYCGKYHQQIHFLNKIMPFSVQSVQELVWVFDIVTIYTRRLRVNVSSSVC